MSSGVIAPLVLAPLSWIALYMRGAEARDLIFRGAIPLLGPLAAMILAFRLKRDTSKRAAPEPR